MKNKYFEQKNFVKNYIYAITIFIITLVIGISIFLMWCKLLLKKIQEKHSLPM